MSVYRPRKTLPFHFACVSTHRSITLRLEFRRVLFRSRQTGGYLEDLDVVLCVLQSAKCRFIGHGRPSLFTSPAFQPTPRLCRAHSSKLPFVSRAPPGRRNTRRRE